MKMTAITLFLAAVICVPAHAKKVEGELATKLRLSLQDVGAKTKIGANVRIISVSDVRCSYTVTRLGSIASCEMQDDIAGRVIRVSDRANRRGDQREVAELVRALRLAGAKVEDRMGGGSLDASSVMCTLQFKFRRVSASCNVRN